MICLDYEQCAIKERFYWPGHFRNIHNWCKSCVSCTTRKTFVPGWRVAVGTIASGQIIATDLVGPLPESDNRNKYILVVTDYFTHWMKIFPVSNQEASTVTMKLADEIFLWFGIHFCIHSLIYQNWSKKNQQWLTVRILKHSGSVKHGCTCFNCRSIDKTHYGCGAACTPQASRVCPVSVHFYLSIITARSPLSPVERVS